ncbi:MAG: phosphodiester glycosidase family protein [Chitinophagaceae bacterium]|nr:phosphodiester glycosidase family protein [Chitinophagaceae bacterium]
MENHRKPIYEELNIPGNHPTMHTQEKSKQIFLFLTALLLLTSLCSITLHSNQEEASFVSFISDPQKQNLSFYWKDENNIPFKSIQNLKQWLQKRKTHLVFAMNGGMYKEDNSPLGLYIENNKLLKKLNTLKGTGNFYTQPNGVFYITDNSKAVICKTDDFSYHANIKYATQSGPLLLTDGKINPLFKEGSANLNIRNGVGILPDGNLIFSISKKEVNFYDFAIFFKSLGCKNALYLDGFVSRMYLPEKNRTQLDGNFGVMIAVIQKEK